VNAAREEILARVRRALADVPSAEHAEDVSVPRGYQEHEPEGTLERFVERLQDYGAAVRLVGADDVARAAADACSARGVVGVAVPPDLPSGWLPAGVEIITDDGLTPRELDRIGGAMTGCALAIAETGTIVLDAGEGQGRRVLSLVPDIHVCVVREDQVVDGVPAALRRVAAGLRAARRPVTFVSGPSATSDIELSRVEGVHGPRQLEVIVMSS
jgi:L-lactate dehydrogenase complex protein LldG